MVTLNRNMIAFPKLDASLEAVDADINRLEECLAELWEAQPEGLLAGLIARIPQTKNQPDANWAMLQVIEAFPADEYAETFLLALPQLWAASKDDAEMMLARMLNSPMHQIGLMKSLPGCSAESRRVLGEVLVFLVERSPEFEGKAGPIKKLVGLVG